MQVQGHPFKGLDVVHFSHRLLRKISRNLLTI
jgi:hypothetical protein